MDLEAVRNLMREERRSSERSGETSEFLEFVTRKTWDGAWNGVIYSNLTTDNADHVIAEQIDHFKALNQPFEWKLFSDDQPADLKERLLSFGFEVGPLEAVVVYDLESGINQLTSTQGCVVEQIRTRQHIDDFRRLADEIFGKDYTITTEALEREIATGSTDHLGYVAYVDGEAASVGRLYTHKDSAFGGLYGGGTLPQFRGRGCYRNVVTERAKDALKLGARYLQVDALPTSLPILLRLGFVHLTDTWPCTWSPP